MAEEVGNSETCKLCDMNLACASQLESRHVRLGWVLDGASLQMGVARAVHPSPLLWNLACREVSTLRLHWPQTLAFSHVHVAESPAESCAPAPVTPPHPHLEGSVGSGRGWMVNG